MVFIYNKSRAMITCCNDGSFDNEPATVALMDTYLEQNGIANKTKGEVSIS